MSKHPVIRIAAATLALALASGAQARLVKINAGPPMRIDLPAFGPTSAAEFGNGFLMRHGYAVAWSGWGGDVRPGANVLSIELPVATNPDGSAITGLVLAEFIPTAPTGTRISLPYPASQITTANGTL